MTPDKFSEGLRLAWSCVPIGVLTIVMGFAVICALGYFAEQIEIANAVQRAMQ